MQIYSTVAGGGGGSGGGGEKHLSAHRLPLNPPHHFFTPIVFRWQHLPSTSKAIACAGHKPGVVLLCSGVQRMKKVLREISWKQWHPNLDWQDWVSLSGIFEEKTGGAKNNMFVLLWLTVCTILLYTICYDHASQDHEAKSLKNCATEPGAHFTPQLGSVNPRILA